MGVINTFLIRWNGGWTERTLGTSPRVEARLDTGAQQSLAAVLQIADAQLLAFGHTRRQIELAQDDINGGGTSPYVDYNVGDTIFIPTDETNVQTTAPMRVASISVTEDNDTGSATVTPEFLEVPSSPGPQMQFPPEASLFQTTKKMTNGTLRGQSKVAQPAVVHSLGLPGPSVAVSPGLLFDGFSAPDGHASEPTDIPWIPANTTGTVVNIDGAVGTDDGIILDGGIGIFGGDSTTPTGTGEVGGRFDRVTVKELSTTSAYVQITVGQANDGFNDLTQLITPTEVVVGLGLRCGGTVVASPSDVVDTAMYPGFWCVWGIFPWDLEYTNVGIYRKMADGSAVQLDSTVAGGFYPAGLNTGDVLKFEVNPPGGGTILRATINGTLIISCADPLTGPAAPSTEAYAGKHGGLYLGGRDSIGQSTEFLEGFLLDNFLAADFVT